MEQYSRSRPPPAPLSLSSPWKSTNTLPYDALSEEGSYGSFSLYAPSPLPPPMHQLSAGKIDPSRLPFPSRTHQSFSENRESPKHLSRSISSIEGLRRNRMPLSEMLSMPEEGPPSPQLPAAASVRNRRPSLSSLMASTDLDFYGPAPAKLDEEMQIPHSHMRHQSASFPAPPFPHASRRTSRASHLGLLSRASSDRFDLDPMIRSSFDQQDYNAGLDPTWMPPQPTNHTNGSSWRGEPVHMQAGDHEMNGLLSSEQHSYRKMQYLRSQSNLTSQDVMNAPPMSPLRSPSARQVIKLHTNNDSFYDPNHVRQRAPMRDVLLPHTDTEPLHTPHLHHSQQIPFTHPPHDSITKGGSRFSLEHYNAHIGAQGSPFDRRHRADTNGNANQQFGLHDPPLYAKSYDTAYQDQQHYKGSSLIHRHDIMQRSMPRNLSNSQKEVLVSSASHGLPLKPLSELMRVSSASSDSRYGEKADRRSYLKAKDQHTENQRKQSFLTKGQSVLDHVTEDIVRKLTLLSHKCVDQSLYSEAASSSASLLFKRALLVQIQALAPQLTDISADEKEVAAQTYWALHRSSIMQRVSKQSRLSHRGLCLLHLQKTLYDIGTSVFDTLMKMRTHLCELLISPSAKNESASGQLRIACVGGAPGCVAIALRLFCVLMKPSWEVRVDILGVDERSKRIVEELSFGDISCAGTESGGVGAVGSNPGMMRHYKMLMLVNCSMGPEGKELEREQWKSMWEDLYENAAAGAVVVVYESVASVSTSRWEDIAPSMGPWHFRSLDPRLEDCVRVGQKL